MNNYRKKKTKYKLIKDEKKQMSRLSKTKKHHKETQQNIQMVQYKHKQK